MDKQGAAKRCINSCLFVNPQSSKTCLSVVVGFRLLLVKREICSTLYFELADIDHESWLKVVLSLGTVTVHPVGQQLMIKTRRNFH